MPQKMTEAFAHEIVCPRCLARAQFREALVIKVHPTAPRAASSTGGSEFVCVCVCVCDRKRDRQTETETEREVGCFEVFPWPKLCFFCS